MNKLCCVFTCDKEYFSKFLYTLHKLRTIGNYTGEVCLVVGDDLKNLMNEKTKNNLITDKNVIIKYFPNLSILSDKNFLISQSELKRPSHWFIKKFQFHKFYLFNTYFKQWDYIFYLDCGVYIYDKIQPILDLYKANTLIANRDGVDNETGTLKPISPGNGLKLGDQFTKDSSIYEKLKNKYNMNEKYFQTTIMLFDTAIIKDNTFTDIYNLLLEYPISITNDQGIISLYFTQIHKHWEQLPRKINNDLYTYDYVRCINKKYIMVKNNSDKWLKTGYNIDDINNKYHIVWLNKNYDNLDINKNILENANIFLTLNNDFTCYKWNNKNSLSLLKEYFPEYLDIYNEIHDLRYKCDLIRLVILYVYGGLYSDVDGLCMETINKMYIDNKIDIAVVFNDRKDELANGLIYIKNPKHIFIKTCLDEYIKILKSKKTGACKIMKNIFDTLYPNLKLGVNNNIVIYQERPDKSLNECKSKVEWWNTFYFYNKDNVKIFKSRYDNYNKDKITKNNKIKFV